MQALIMGATARKACWACRSSKIRCDLNTPICRNCARSGKGCQYGLRLSWPRKGDVRRSIVSSCRPSDAVSAENAFIRPHFLNVTSSDTALYLLLSSSCANIFISESVIRPDSCVPKPLSWIPSGSGKFENVLMSYYEEALSVMLTSAKDKRFQGLLIGMSFCDGSPSSVAVQQAMYALTARYVCASIRAMQFKLNAITALNQSFQSSLNAKDGLQHIAAGLLLSLCEMLDSSETNQWITYAWGAKEVAKTYYFPGQVYEGDASVILNWLFYHDALFNFSVRHWRHQTSGLELCIHDDHIRRAVLLSGNTSKIINTIGCSTEVLEIIAKICIQVLDPNDPARNSSEHIETLDHLERKLTYAKQYNDQENESEPSIGDESVEKVAELYRLAGLIYLYRAGRGFSSRKSNVRMIVETGLEIAAGLKTCTRAFPIVILGCEAHCDNDRLVILELLHRTHDCCRIGNIVRAQRFIEASWAQDDLHMEDELDYVRKFDTIMSQSRYVPSFA